MKNLIIFDLDGTLAKSKSPIDEEMADIFGRLLCVVQVAIISGGDWPQFEKQVLKHLPRSTALDKLTILPTCGTKLYQYKHGWVKMYEESFTSGEKRKILDNLHHAIAEADLNISQTWGDQIEDRGSQITFSALGQQAPLDEKKHWDPDFEKRKKIIAPLSESLKEFSVAMGGTTSVDITKQGIDKGYGIKKLMGVLDIDISEILFIGDALFKGGNDYPARKTGVDVIQVRDPEETKNIIRTIFMCCAPTKNKREL